MLTNQIKFQPATTIPDTHQETEKVTQNLVDKNHSKLSMNTYKSQFCYPTITWPIFFRQRNCCAYSEVTEHNADPHHLTILYVSLLACIHQIFCFDHGTWWHLEIRTILCSSTLHSIGKVLNLKTWAFWRYSNKCHFCSKHTQPSLEVTFEACSPDRNKCSAKHKLSDKLYKTVIATDFQNKIYVLLNWKRNSQYLPQS